MRGNAVAGPRRGVHQRITASGDTRRPCGRESCGSDTLLNLARSRYATCPTRSSVAAHPGRCCSSSSSLDPAVERPLECVPGIRQGTMRRRPGSPPTRCNGIGRRARCERRASGGVAAFTTQVSHQVAAMFRSANASPAARSGQLPDPSLDEQDHDACLGSPDDVRKLWFACGISRYRRSLMRSAVLEVAHRGYAGTFTGIRALLMAGLVVV
jgi:hypothetical protein